MEYRNLYGEWMPQKLGERHFLCHSLLDRNGKIILLSIGWNIVSKPHAQELGPWFIKSKLNLGSEHAKGFWITFSEIKVHKQLCIRRYVRTHSLPFVFHKIPNISNSVGNCTVHYDGPQRKFLVGWCIVCDIYQCLNMAVFWNE